MREHAAMSEATASRGVLALSGYGVRVGVERGHLLVSDGVGNDRREGRFARVGHGLERLLVLGHSGSISLEALRWLHELDIAFVQLGRDGELIATGTPNRLRDVRLLRAQALAMHSAGGLGIARELIAEKVKGQARVLDQIEGHRSERQAVAEVLERIPSADTLDGLRFLESRAAAAYWGAWVQLPVRFAGREAKRVPAHWRTFGMRSSPLTSSPRKAATPGNALLNYLYAIVEAEARLAALAVGCDPALGIIHTDARGRDSLACDLMEPVRPHVDAAVLSLLDGQTFVRNDFFEARDGNCRLMPEIARPLATTALQWAKRVAPVAERVGGAFLSLPTSVASSSMCVTGKASPAVRFRTPLTGRNYSRPKHPKPVPAPVALPNRCRGCGMDLGARKRVYCDACLPEAGRKAVMKAVAVQRQQRDAGLDGRSSKSAREKHRAHTTRQMKEAREWELRQTSIPSRAVYDRDIAPLVRDVPSDVLAEATGLSVRTCGNIRRQRFRPHARHWKELERAARAFHRKHPTRLDHRYDADFFPREIASNLQRLQAEDIAQSTGLSASYSRRIRHGHHIPDARHWSALYDLVRRVRDKGAKK